jgi:hypothetical protein
MQMLYVGGHPITGEWPTFEDERATRLLPDDSSWLRDVEGRAIKILRPNLYLPNIPMNAKAVWLDRDPKEQAKSMMKVQKEIIRLPVTKEIMAKQRRMFQKERKYAIQRLEQVCGERPLMLRYEDQVKNPRMVAIALAAHTGWDLDIDRMTKVVMLRSPKCLPGFLEPALMRLGPP